MSTIWRPVCFLVLNFSLKTCVVPREYYHGCWIADARENEKTAEGSTCRITFVLRKPRGSKNSKSIVLCYLNARGALTARFESQDAGRRFRFGCTRRWSIKWI